MKGDMVCFICGSTFFQHSKSGPLTWWENAKTKEVVMMPGVKYGKKTLNMCKPYIFHYFFLYG